MQFYRLATGMRKSRNYDAVSSDVQFGQRIAVIGIVDMQKEHSLVVGSSSGASSSACILLIPLMSIKTAKATMRKLITVFIKTP